MLKQVVFRSGRIVFCQDPQRTTNTTVSHNLIQMGTISDYELQRRLNIERNRALFQDLGLDATLQDIRKQKEQVIIFLSQ